MKAFNLEEIRRTNPALAKRIEDAIGGNANADNHHSGLCDQQPERAELPSLDGQVQAEEILDGDAARLCVTIERHSSRELDYDNFVGGAKQLRDAIAELLGRKGDAEEDGLVFRYVQKRAKRKKTVIRIEKMEEEK